MATIPVLCSVDRTPSHFCFKISVCWLCTEKVNILQCANVKLFSPSLQVSHHPPIVAQYVEGMSGWHSWQEFSMSSKFRGKYLQIIPLGIAHLKFLVSGKLMFFWGGYLSHLRFSLLFVMFMFFAAKEDIDECFVRWKSIQCIHSCSINIFPFHIFFR